MANAKGADLFARGGKGLVGERVARGREGASASLLWRWKLRKRSRATKVVDRARGAGSESRLGGVGRFGLEMFCRWIKSRYRVQCRREKLGCEDFSNPHC